MLRWNKNQLESVQHLTSRGQFGLHHIPFLAAYAGKVLTLRSLVILFVLFVVCLFLLLVGERAGCRGVELDFVC